MSQSLQECGVIFVTQSLATVLCRFVYSQEPSLAKLLHDCVRRVAEVLLPLLPVRVDLLLHQLPDALLQLHLLAVVEATLQGGLQRGGTGCSGQTSVDNSLTRCFHDFFLIK